MAAAQMIDIPVVRDPTGAIGIIEPRKILPFEVRRTYHLFDITSGAHRGEHAHRNLSQFILVLSGAAQVALHDGHHSFKFTLNQPTRGLLVPPGYWRTLGGFSGGTTVLVLASEEYDEGDYIRDFQEFLRWKRSQ